MSASGSQSTLTCGAHKVPGQKSRRRFVLAFVLLALAGNTAVFAADPLALPAGQISLQSPAGTRLLDESDARSDFYALIPHMNSQQKLSYCGVATAVTVLNTLQPTNTPLCETLEGKVAYFDQSNFFSKQVEEVVPQSVVAKKGFTLEQWAAAVGSYGVKTEAWHCGEAGGQAGFAAFLTRAKAALRSTNQFLVVNFQRKALGQAGNSGHFSPVGAYNEKEARFLVLDVAPFKYAFFWVDAKLLWNAMNTEDNVSRKNRGFVIVSAAPKEP
jgi:hypothetical protein